MGALPAFGLPALTCFSIVRDTAARLLSVLGLEIAGGAPVGAAAHYLIGPVIDAIFGASVTQINALRAGTVKKGIVLAILYVEIHEPTDSGYGARPVEYDGAGDSTVVRRSFQDAPAVRHCPWRAPSWRAEACESFGLNPLKNRQRLEGHSSEAGCADGAQPAF
jgi:hypothetical protein